MVCQAMIKTKRRDKKKKNATTLDENSFIIIINLKKLKLPFPKEARTNKGNKKFGNQSTI